MRRRSRREFGHGAPTLKYTAIEFLILARIYDVNARAEHSNGRIVRIRRLQRADMRVRVAATRKARYNRHAMRCEAAAERERHLFSIVGARTRADDRQR
ncbi:hypothetical protein SDC9_201214 [bioreactor metagenome]|uniref:Uncharacterized protein n=1 Tax=bioreactor metagenome TaxID=1076179 RepID=A0A645IRI1_9ZZZZ